MVLPIGFFMPLPLAMMIPFMGIQSAVMAKQFGENFQYGKRRISAMSNEEFNKLTPANLMQRANEELKSMIPSMETSIVEMRDFQKFIISEFIAMINDLIKSGFSSFFGTEVTSAVEHFMHGHPLGHDNSGIIPPPNLGLTDEEKQKIIDDMNEKNKSPPDPSNPNWTEDYDIPNPVIPPKTGNKKKAGQSQILERGKLIKFIAKQASMAREHSQHAHPVHVKSLLKNMTDAQQKLVNLLSRYRF